ncbi:MAG: hypothetical protein ACT4OM_00965 [Actinomycetota bacterium]
MPRRTRCTCLLFTALAVLFVPAPALAADFRSGERNVEITGTVDDDVYAASQNVSVPGDVAGDLIALGQKITLSGSAGGTMLAAGQQVTVSGSVAGTLRATGQDIVVNGSVEGDLMAVGDDVSVGSDGSVGRDLLVGGGDVEVAGTVGRDFKGEMDRLTISGTVDGDVEVRVDRIALERGARIGGDLIYTSDERYEIPDGVTVVGRVVRRIPAVAIGPNDPIAFVLGVSRSAGVVLVLGLLLTLLFPRFLPASSSVMRTSPAASFGVGVAALLAIPALAILAGILSGLAGAGFSLVVILAAGFTALILLAKVIAAYSLGAAIVRVRVSEPRPPAGKSILALLIGAVIVGLLSSLPIAGAIVNGLILLFAIGAVVVAIFRYRRPLPGRGGDPAARPAEPSPAPVPATTSAARPL